MSLLPPEKVDKNSTPLSEFLRLPLPPLSSYSSPLQNGWVSVGLLHVFLSDAVGESVSLETLFQRMHIQLIAVEAYLVLSFTTRLKVFQFFKTLEVFYNLGILNKAK